MWRFIQNAHNGFQNVAEFVDVVVFILVSTVVCQPKSEGGLCTVVCPLKVGFGKTYPLGLGDPMGHGVWKPESKWWEE
jgi:hypothetical protein